jgi:hypothetical protein
MNSFAGSSEATYKGYTMSKRVDRKIQSKVKCLEMNLLWISPDTDKFGEGVAPNDGNTYDKES